MGQGQIISGGPAGLYNINILNEISRVTSRIAAITTRLAGIATQRVTFQAAVTAAESNLAAAAYERATAIAELIAHTGTAAQVTAAQTAYNQAVLALSMAQAALSRLGLEEASLKKEKTALQAIPATQALTGVWCADYSENLSGVIGTIEIDGEDDQILITPGGAAGLGKLQPSAAGTPAGTFWNWALLPCWQKWKPTYRRGKIISLDYTQKTCSVCILAAYSSAQGLPINQSGTAYVVAETAPAGYIEWAAENPTNPLVTNTSEEMLALTPALMTQLRAVNDEINNHNSYLRDTEQYGELENWAEMNPGGAGDCEDFALTKAKKLIEAGIPAGALKIETGLTTSGGGHAWLTVATDKGDLSLDINYRDVIPSNTMNYKNRKRLSGGAWGQAGVRLDDVPIVYMD